MGGGEAGAKLPREILKYAHLAHSQGELTKNKPKLTVEITCI